MNRTWIELDREALAHNIRRYQSLLPAGCRIMGVVKADAYGHGARAVAAQLWELGIRHFATATLDEAVQLREAGIQGEILILGYSAPAYFHLLAEHGLTQTATCPDHAAQLETYCRENGVRLKVHIAVDTGMHRIGFLPEDLDAIRALAREDKAVAIGEIGLDYYWPENPPRPLQQQVLRSQLALARELSLPVIIHDRDAHADTMAIVREFPGLRGVFHCFAGSVEMARELVDMGWYLSFNGAATFKNARKAPEVIRAVPMERLMIETDAPYLTPVPYRGRRNDSTYVRLVAEKIAQLRDMTPQEVEQATWENGKRFFGI